MRSVLGFVLFFFNDTATTEIYTLSLHDALPIWRRSSSSRAVTASRENPAARRAAGSRRGSRRAPAARRARSEEHTSELQSLTNLVCRLLLEKKKMHTVSTIRPLQLRTILRQCPT